MEERAANADKGLKVLLEFVWLGLVATCVKLLLVRSYRSTDFEVHRHWAALTYSLPLREWYFDETSPWTLDYPPVFAYFERFVSVFANLVDPKIVQLRDGLNYDALSSIYFQRITVIVTDLCLFSAAYRLTKRLDYVRRFVVWVLIIASPGLLIVDHMHFQYSGFLLGLLLLSLSFLEEGRDLEGGFLFAALLCFKHLYAVAAPVYFVYLLRHYCRGGLVRGFTRLLAMGTVVASVFAVAFGPFLYHGQITPLTTLILVLLSMSPCLVKSWKHPHPKMMTRWVACAYTCGFLFGWLVHEKASLHFVIPLALVATDSVEDAKHYFIMSVVSCYSLFPLLFENQEYPIKVLLLLLHSLLMWIGFSTLFHVTDKPATARKGSRKTATRKRDFDIGCMGNMHLLGLVGVEVWGQFFHPYLFNDRLPFVPLMMISVYGALGMMYYWIWQLKRILYAC